MAYRFKTLAEETTFKFKAAAVVNLEQEYETGRNVKVTPLSAVPSPANGGPAAWTQLGDAMVGTGGAIGGGGSPNAAFDVRLSAAVVAVAGTMTVTGGVTFDITTTGVAVTLRRYKRSDDSLVATVINAAAVDFVATVQKTWATILGAACTFAPATAQEEYLVATVSGGTPTVASETSQRFGYVARATTKPTVTAARLSDTSVRLTVTNGAGLTNRAYHSTVADSGATWTEDGTSAGNGTIDITVPAATDCYFMVVGDSGTYSLPSNVVKMSTSVGSGTTMTVLGWPQLLRQTEADQSVPGEDRIVARYALGPLTLASANLERGDYLPANSDRSIVATTWEIVSSVEMPAKGEFPRHAACTARKVRVTW